MKHLPYDNFKPREFIVRDWLALDRTTLANERTFLAYSRTALTLVIAGLTFVRFFGHQLFAALGYLFIVGGISVFVFGVRRFRKMATHYKNLSRIEESELPASLQLSQEPKVSQPVR